MILQSLRRTGKRTPLSMQIISRSPRPVICKRSEVRTSDVASGPVPLKLLASAPVAALFLIHTYLQMGDEQWTQITGTVSTVCGGAGETVQTVFGRLTKVPDTQLKVGCE
jgi:hypothetical protein